MIHGFVIVIFIHFKPVQHQTKSIYPPGLSSSKCGYIALPIWQLDSFNAQNSTIRALTNWGLVTAWTIICPRSCCLKLHSVAMLHTSVIARRRTLYVRLLKREKVGQCGKRKALLYYCVIPTRRWIQKRTRDRRTKRKTTHKIAFSRRSEERRVGKECRSRWSPYH